MKAVAEALGISRPHLTQTRDGGSKSPPKAPKARSGDEELLTRIRKLIDGRPTYGYRRVTAMLNREEDHPPVNHKRVYRVMRAAGMLLAKHGTKPVREHTGTVITLASDMRWCSDMFEIRCWNGEKVHVAFSLDCCDREAIAWVAAAEHLDGTDVRDLMAETIEARFSATRTPKPIEWLSDNGPPYTANETRRFGTECGLAIRNTPSYSPESNGMAEAFVKTFKRDYVYINDVSSAEVVLAQLPVWFEDYNEIHPHKGLKMLSPRQFRRAKSA